MCEDEALIKSIDCYQRSLNKYAKNGNSDKLLHVIRKLHRLPVKVAHLERTGVGRTVNALRKLGGAVGDAAKALVARWKEMVVQEEEEREKENQVHYEASSDSEGGPDEAAAPDSDDSGVERESYVSGDEEDSPNIQIVDYSDRESSRKRPSDTDGTTSAPKRPKLTDADFSTPSSSRRSNFDSGAPSGSRSDSDSDETENKDEKELKNNEKRHKDKHKSHKDKDKGRKDKDRSQDRDKGCEKDRKEKSHKERDKSNRNDDRSHKSQKNEEKSHRSKDKTHKDEDRGRKDDSRSHKSSKDKHKSHKDKDREHKSSEDKHTHHKSKEKSKKSDNFQSPSGSSSKHSKDHEDKSKSSSKKDDAKKSSSKSKPSKPAVLMNGGGEIDSHSGTSFAEALGMLNPSTSFDKASTSHSGSKSKSSPEKKKSRRETTKKDEELTEMPKLLTDEQYCPKLNALDLKLDAALPPITPNYRPLGNMPLDVYQKKMSDSEALSRVISQKNVRTKVYSGNKVTHLKVPSLFEMCIRVLQDNIDALEYTGGVPYSVLKPVLEKCTATQLFTLEHHNPYLIEDSDELWQLHCQREFRNKTRDEMETWREMYMRCVDERNARLKALTATIKQAQDKSLPVRTTKLAYVDSVVKPPRDVARKQAKNGTAASVNNVNSKRSSTASKLSSLATAGEAGKVAVPNPGARAVDNRAGAASSSMAVVKPKKAPLMAKSLSLFKNRFRR